MTAAKESVPLTKIKGSCVDNNAVVPVRYNVGPVPRKYNTTPTLQGCSIASSPDLSCSLYTWQAEQTKVKSTVQCPMKCAKHAGKHKLKLVAFVFCTAFVAEASQNWCFGLCWIWMAVSLLKSSKLPLLPNFHPQGIRSSKVYIWWLTSHFS